jgi:putative redox protein
MKKQIECNWTGKLAFETLVDGHRLLLDVDEENGGQNSGPRPKTLLLSALAGCTGMDVVAMLTKMRVELTSFRTLVEGETSEEHPKVFTSIHIKYIFRGENLDLEKLQKAVDLSQERYCAVSAQLRQSVPVTYEILTE